MNLHGYLVGGNKRIWIVDDVLTTGSTIRTIASTLRKRYALVDICSFCLARTEGYVGDLERGLLFGEHHGWDIQWGWVAGEEDVGYGEEWVPTAGSSPRPAFGNEGIWLGIDCASAQKNLPMGLKQVEIFEFLILGYSSAFLVSNMASQSSNRVDSRSPDPTFKGKSNSWTFLFLLNQANLGSILPIYRSHMFFFFT